MKRSKFIFMAFFFLAIVSLFFWYANTLKETNQLYGPVANKEMKK